MGVDRIAWLRERIAQAESMLDSDLSTSAFFSWQCELEMLRVELNDRLQEKSAWDRRVAESEDLQHDEV